MLTRRFSTAYAITPGAGDQRAGTIGLYFSAAGNAVVVTPAGDTVTVIGVVGTIFDVPVQKVTSATGTVLGLVGV